MYIDIHTHNKSALCAVVNLFHSEAVPTHGVFSVGLHPWHIRLHDSESLGFDLLDKFAKSNVVAIGECGLDRLKPPALEVQSEVFRWHVEQSELFAKPLIIHCVRAFEELIAIKRSLQPSQAWVIHGFRGNRNVLNRLLQNGFYVSLCAILLQHRDRLIGYLNDIPLNRLFFETDEYAFDTKEMYCVAAESLNVDVETLSSIISDNFARVFKMNADALERT